MCHPVVYLSITCLSDVDLSVVHKVEDGGEVSESDAVEEDDGRGVRVLLQHLPEERRARREHQLVRPE